MNTLTYIGFQANTNFFYLFSKLSKIDSNPYLYHNYSSLYQKITIYITQSQNISTQQRGRPKQLKSECNANKINIDFHVKI